MAVSAAAAIVPLKKNVDEALTLKDAAGELLAKTIEKVIVLRRTSQEIQIQEGRDVWWHREMQYVGADCPAEKMESESPLFILYTSGSTGKPKGILHTTAGYLLGAKDDHQIRLRSAAGGRLLVYRRRRLGHGPQLRGLRPAGQRRDQLHVRGRAQLSRSRTASGASWPSTA